MSLDISLPGLCKKRRRIIMTRVVFVAELRHFLQYVFINRRCELSPRRVFTDTCEEDSGGERTNHPPTLSPRLPSLTSSLVSPFFSSSFFMPRSTARGNMFLMSVPLPLSLGSFSPSQTQPLLWLSCSFLYVCQRTFHKRPLSWV